MDSLSEHADASFDVVLVSDVGAAADAEALLGQVRRVLEQDGVAVIALPNRDATGGLSGAAPPSLGYYDLYDLCASLWPNVRMYGQSPFVGYAVAEFAAAGDDGAVSFDASLVGGESEEVEFFLAICGEAAVPLDPFSVVQIPLGAVAPREVDGMAAPVDDGRGAELQGALEEAHARLEELRAEVGERGIRSTRLEHELRAMEEEAAKARERAVRFARELEDEKKARQRAEIEGQLARKAPDLREARERADSLAVEIEAAQVRIRSLEQQVAHAVDEAREIATDRDRLAEEVEAVHANLAQQAGEAAVAASAASEHEVLTREVSALRASLDGSDAERGAEVEKLERELAARVREIGAARAESERQRSIVGDLVAQLGEASRRPAVEPEEVARLRESLRQIEQERDRASRDLEETASALVAERDDAVVRAAQLQARVVELEGEAQAARWDTSLAQSQLMESGESAQAGRAAVTALEAALDTERRRAADTERASDGAAARFEEYQQQAARAREESRDAELRATEAEWRRQQAEAWLADMRTQTASAVGALQGAKMRIGELEEEAATRGRSSSTLEDELHASLGRIVGIEASVRELRAAASEAKEALDHERAAHARARETLETLRRQEAERQGAFDRLLASLQGEARGYRVRLYEVAAERDQALARLEEVGGGVGEVQGRLRGLEDEQEAARVRIRALEAERDAARAVAESAERARSEAEQALARRNDEGAAEEQAASLRAEAGSREVGEIRGLRFAFAEAKARIGDLEAAAWEASAEIGRLKGVVRRERLESEERMEAAARELADAREALSSIRHDADQAREELARLAERTSDLGTDVGRLRDAHHRADEDLERLRAELSTAVTDQGRLETAIEERDQRLVAQTDLLREREVALERIAGDLAEAGARLAESERTRAKLETDLADARDAKAAAQGADLDASQAVERLRKETVTRDERIRALTSEREAIEDRAVAAEGKLVAVQEALGRISEEPLAGELGEEIRALLRVLGS